MEYRRVPRSYGVLLEYSLVMVVPHNKALGVLLSSLLILLLWKLCIPLYLAAQVTPQLIPPTGPPQRLAPLYGCRLELVLMVYGLSGLYRR